MRKDSSKKEIANGAEARIFELEGNIAKERVRKSYRHPELDLELRKSRTKREASILKKIKAPHPRLISTDNEQEIIMEKVKGQKVRDALDLKPLLAHKMGEIVAQLHNENIIHGDLTTSNMMIDASEKIILIDFGLSYHSQKLEDKAVDIHLLKEALESRHFKVYDTALKNFLKGYQKAHGYKDIMKRLKEVEMRGRYRKG
jgi:Kae1-associated kinase Bud32